MSNVILFAGATSGSGSFGILHGILGLGPGVIYQVGSAPLSTAARSIIGTIIVGHVSTANDLGITRDIAGTILVGEIGDGTFGVARRVEGVVLHGSIGSGAQGILHGIEGVLAHGSIGSGSFGLARRIMTLYPSPSGVIGSGSFGILHGITNGSIFVTATGYGAFGLARGVTSPLMAVAVMPTADYVNFVLNLSGMAASEYSTHFNSFAEIDGEVYAASSAGLHRLGARTDNGAAIQAVIGKYDTNFGSPLEKVVTDAHFRLRCEGNLTMTVASDKGGGTVTLVDGIAQMHGSTLGLPRGARGSEHAFTVQNVAGAYFEIAELELLLLMAQSRRGGRVRG